MLTTVNGYSVNTHVVNAGRVYTQSCDIGEHAVVTVPARTGIFGSSVAEELSDVKVLGSRGIIGELDPFGRIVTVTWFYSESWWPIFQVADVSVPALVRRWGSLPVDTRIDVEAPAARAPLSIIAPAETVSVWLDGWPDAKQYKHGSKMLEVSLLLVSAVVKMWGYPIVVTTEVSADSVIKKSFRLDTIDVYTEFYSGSDIRSWYYPVEANSDLLVGGTVRRATPLVIVAPVTTSDFVGNVRMANASTTDEQVVLNPGEVIVLFDGSVRLDLCTSECPVYP